MKIIVILVVLVVIILQIFSFVRTLQKANILKNFFCDVDGLRLKNTSITQEILADKNKFKNFLIKIPEKDTLSENVLEINLIDNTNIQNSLLKDVINRTNEYLCKNTSTSADLDLLENICSNQIENIDEEIHHNLNTPLFLGLAGTFVGIIVGLSCIDLNEIIGGTENWHVGISELFNGVTIAMLASFIGLILTIVNTSIIYPMAYKKVEEGKENYESFLRREIMPVLSNSMSSSLTSLKNVLGHFVDKFGQNLEGYTESAKLLNENLQEQHSVLIELNKLSLTQTANKIANTFMQLKESSEELQIFQTYQKELNITMSNVSNTMIQVKNLIEKFDGFSEGLSIVISNQNKMSELQKNFQDAITTHFPIGNDARDIWRKDFDELMSDSKEVSIKLSEQLTSSTEYIRNFVSDNKDFFTTFDDLKNVLEQMSLNSKVQSDCYKDLKKEIELLRNEYIDSNIQSIETQKSLIKVVEELSKKQK